MPVADVDVGMGELLSSSSLGFGRRQWGRFLKVISVLSLMLGLGWIVVWPLLFVVATGFDIVSLVFGVVLGMVGLLPLALVSIFFGLLGWWVGRLPDVETLSQFAEGLQYTGPKEDWVARWSDLEALQCDPPDQSSAAIKLNFRGQPQHTLALFGNLAGVLAAARESVDSVLAPAFHQRLDDGETLVFGTVRMNSDSIKPGTLGAWIKWSRIRGVTLDWKRRIRLSESTGYSALAPFTDEWGNVPNARFVFAYAQQRALSAPEDMAA